MSEPVTLEEAKAFLRVSHGFEDGLIATLIAAAKVRIEGEAGVSLTAASPAPLRLCVLWLVAQSYQNRGEGAADLSALEAWLAPYREVRL